MTPVLCQAPHTAPLTSASLELCNDLAILPSCISPNSKLCHLWVFTHGYWRRQWQPTPVLLPGKSHGQRSLVGCSPWGCKESDTTERPHFHFSLSCTGEGNGNPLQYSCLENPRDGGAWCAAVCGVTQSRTRLKQLSSSSSILVWRIPWTEEPGRLQSMGSQGVGHTHTVGTDLWQNLL